MRTTASSEAAITALSCTSMARTAAAAAPSLPPARALPQPVAAVRAPPPSLAGSFASPTAAPFDPRPGASHCTRRASLTHMRWSELREVHATRSRCGSRATRVRRARTQRRSRQSGKGWLRRTRTPMGASASHATRSLSSPERTRLSWCEIKVARPRRCAAAHAASASAIGAAWARTPWACPRASASGALLPRATFWSKPSARKRCADGSSGRARRCRGGRATACLRRRQALQDK